MKQKLLQKLSVVLVSTLLLSLLVPVLAFAATSIAFYYDASSNKLKGYIYTDDPAAVELDVTHDNTVTSVTYVQYGTIDSNPLYDDNNKRYYSVMDVNVQSDTAPSSIAIKENGQLKGNALVIGDWYIYASDPSVTIDVYRIPATVTLSTYSPGAYLPAGASLFDFTPADSGLSAAKIMLPSSVTEATYLNTSALQLSDLELVDLTTGTSLPLNGFSMGTSYLNSVATGADVMVSSSTTFTPGKRYGVRLSSSASGNEIRLPGDGKYDAAVYVGIFKMPPEVTNPYFYRKEVQYFHDLVIGNPTEPSTSDSSPGSTSSTPSSGYTGGVSPAAPDEGTNVVNEDSLKNGKDGKVAVKIGHGDKAVLLPLHAANIVAGNHVELDGDNFTATLQPETLADLAELAKESKIENGQISFSFNALDKPEVTAVLEKAKNKTGINLKAAGEVIDFSLGVKGADGKTVKLEKFNKPLTLKFKLNADSNPDLAGVYFIGDDGSLEFVGGTVKDGYLIAKVKHFSKYAALEYKKTFIDVPVDNWAEKAIASMTAKHVTEGINAQQFAPSKETTRAEFVSMLVRALGLEASGKSAYSDVKADAWYASAIAAASEAGIAAGRSETEFAPNEVITREEMALMLVHAYEVKTGKKLSGSASFADADKISPWALQAIEAAAANGLLNGRSQQQFVPKQTATRAESAQAVYNLLNKM